MWLVEGSFDQIGAANLEQKKLKLLKPGKTYPLGRKQNHPLQLVLSHPKISGEHVTFVVGEHPVDSVSDPNFRPTLKLHNHRNKALQVSRTTNGTVTRHMLQPMSEDEVMPGDCIALVTGIYISIHWKPICCLVSPDTSISFEKCASLGIKVVSTPRPEVSHHLTVSLSVTTSLALSLLTLAHVVRPDWLTELLHLGETTASAGGPSVLESEFRLPALSQYVPKSDPALPATLKSPAIWGPNERRAGMLKGWRFLFVGEKGREVDTETRTLVERGGGEYEAFDVSGGVTRWRQALSRNKRKAEAERGKGLSVVADVEAMKIAVGDAWPSMLEELNRTELSFVTRRALLEAVLSVDTGRINSSISVQTEKVSSIPDMVPNTHDNELSAQSGPSHSSEIPISAAHAVQKARVPAPQASTPGVNDLGNDRPGGQAEIPVSPRPEEVQGSVRVSEEPDGTATRRRPLVRRARTNATQALILGVDDPSFASFSHSPSPVPEVHTGDSSSAALPVRPRTAEKPPSSTGGLAGRSARLKKRARIDKDYNPILASLEEEIAAATAPTSGQPPLKRFKALFDETDPDRAESQMITGVSGGILDSQMISETAAESREDASHNGNGPSQAPPLVMIREEQVESQSLPTAEDVVMETDGFARSRQKEQIKPPSKAAGSIPEPFDSTQVTKRSASKAGAAPGQPDTDAAFLQALASTKKGKRREDDFDREFNNLRISKPERGHNEEAEQDWDVLADFGDDSNLRGNFMVIVEMDVPESRKESSRDTSRATSVEQTRGPDFKKFKKKLSARERPSVELVADEGNDYGMGAAYWKGSQSQHQSQDAVSQGDFTSIAPQGFLQPSQNQNRGFLQPKAGPSSQVPKPRSQNRAQTQSKAVKTKMQGAPPSSRIGQVMDEDDGDNEGAKPRASRSQTANRTNGKGQHGKTQPLFLSDDEDETGSMGKENHADDQDDVELNLDFDDEDMSDDEQPAAPTLRSTAQSSADTANAKPTASPRKRGVVAKKRGTAALLDDDSDTGVAFKGFGSRKKVKAK